MQFIVEKRNGQKKEDGHFTLFMSISEISPTLNEMFLPPLMMGAYNALTITREKSVDVRQFPNRSKHRGCSDA